MPKLADRLEDDRKDKGWLDDDKLNSQTGSSQSNPPTSSTNSSSHSSSGYSSMRGQSAGIPKENQPVSPTASGSSTASKPSSGKPKPAEPHDGGKSPGGKSFNAKNAAMNKAVDKIPGGKNKTGAEQAVDKKAGNFARAAAVASGVGALFANTIGKVVEKIGVKKLGLLAVIAFSPFILLLLIFSYVATHPWEAAKEVLTNSSIRRFALNAAKQAGTSTVSTIIGALSYETDYKPGTALAATGQRPEPGTMLDVISKIDFEKSKNRYKQTNCPYKVMTKKVVAFDGKQRSVISKVTDKSGATVKASDPEVFTCVLEQYPVIETMMRSPEARKINKQMNVNLAYAEKKDSEVIKGKSKEEVKESLLKKTTDRVWRNGKDSAGILYPDSCQKDYKPTGEKADKAIKKIANDLLCGIKPEDIKIDYPVEDMPTDNSIPTDKQKIGQAEAICIFYEKLNKNPDDAKKQRRDRAVSSARAGVQALTLADTGIAGEIQTAELNNDFFKLAGFASSRAYNQEINNISTGVQMDPEAIPTTQIGLTKAFVDGIFNEGKLSLETECNTLKKTKPTTATQNVLNVQNLTLILKARIAEKSPAAFKVPSNPTIGLANYVTTSDLIIRTVRLVSNVSNSGAEGGENNFNRMTVGAKNTMHNYTISLLGGTYQDDAEAAADSIALETIKRNEDKQSGMIARLFSTKNPRSLASRIAAGSTASPKQITENTTRYAVNLLNPIKAFADINTHIAYIGYGESNKAMAAADDDREYWKLDTAGTKPALDGKEINTLQNAREIEGMKKRGTNAELFAAWDKCLETYYPDEQAVDDAKDENCMVMRETKGGKKAASYGKNRALARKYGNYKGNMNLLTAWAKASSDEQDDSIYAKGENSSGFGAGGAAGGAVGGAVGGGSPDGPCPQEDGITTAAEDAANNIGKGGIAQTYVGRGTPDKKIQLCKVQGITVNSGVASNLNKMINAARADSVGLTGSGFRSYESQVRLRREHCGTSDFDIYEKRAGACSPPTARPGNSRHEQGAAIDFRLSGGDFAWLKKNAAKYSFYNLPSEAWHWSDNGK